VQRVSPIPVAQIGVTTSELPRVAESLAGLSEAEAARRCAAGLGNQLAAPTGRTYAEILRENVFTFVNNILFGLGFALLLLGQHTDALVSVGVVAANLLVGVVQEVRAKRILDRIALLTRPTATVIRESQTRTVDPGEIVSGDLLILTPGDQVVADGPVVQGRIEVDESLLTGESHAVLKQAGDTLHSGTFAASGSAVYRAEQVGAASLANQLTASARAFRRVLTPLQRQVHLVVRLILVLAVTLGLVVLAAAVVDGTSLVESVRMAVVIAGLVPNGLFLAIAVAYALAAIRISGKGLLVQQANAVESLSHVDTLCLDKTGTLTTGRLHLRHLQPIGAPEAQLRQLLGEFVASAASGNHTSSAIGAACPGTPRQVGEEVPFVSARRWSAVQLVDRGIFVLGAPDVLSPRTLLDEVQVWAEQGLRVLLFASAPEALSLYDAEGQPRLPERLQPLGLIALEDELRPAARETLNGFAAAGVQLKLISGDHPAAAYAIARQVGLAWDHPPITGADLADLDASQLRQVVNSANVFGRIGPRQKHAIIQALRQQGHYVAMVGDGVNDVLALKQADLAVALQSGTQATRSIADLVLLDDSFGALPHVVREGQRIVRGLLDILRLFLVRVLYTALLIVFVGVIHAGFPLGPRHNALLALLTVGIPTLALAAWARPEQLPRGGMLRWLAHFVAPAAWSTALLGFVVYMAYFLPARAAALHLGPGIEQADALLAARALAQTALTTISILCGLALVVFAEPPSPFWTGGAPLSRDLRPTLLAVGLLAAYAAIILVPPLRILFDLAPLRATDLVGLSAAAIAWAIGLRWAWRSRLVERLLEA
jgi:cation-transporting ATPase E